jgi:hypothetical protein
VCVFSYLYFEETRGVKVQKHFEETRGVSREMFYPLSTLFAYALLSQSVLGQAVTEGAANGLLL